MAQITGTPQTADDELLVRAANMNIHQYVETPKEGKYDDEVQTLIAVNERTGFANSVEILVPSADEVKKYKRWFNTSAGNYGYGSRIVNGDTGVSQGDGGGVLVEFILTPKRHITKKADTAFEATEEADAA